LEKIENLHIIGRNGTHHYYTMEDSILSGLKTARKIIRTDFSNDTTNQENQILQASCTL
jgi:hypothetical protein